MVIASGAVDEDIAGEIAEVCLKHNLPVSCEYGAEKLLKVALSDKKRSGDYITLVVPEKIGKCVLKSVAVSELEDVLKCK